MGGGFTKQNYMPLSHQAPDDTEWCEGQSVLWEGASHTRPKNALILVALFGRHRLVQTHLEEVPVAVHGRSAECAQSLGVFHQSSHPPPTCASTQREASVFLP